MCVEAGVCVEEGVCVGERENPFCYLCHNNLLTYLFICYFIVCDTALPAKTQRFVIYLGGKDHDFLF